MFYLNNCNAKDLTKEFDNFFKNGVFGNALKADLEETDKNLPACRHDCVCVEG